MQQPPKRSEKLEVRSKNPGHFSTVLSSWVLFQIPFKISGRGWSVWQEKRMIFMPGKEDDIYARKRGWWVGQEKVQILSLCFSCQSSLQPSTISGGKDRKSSFFNIRAIFQRHHLCCFGLLRKLKWNLFDVKGKWYTEISRVLMCKRSSFWDRVSFQNDIMLIQGLF